MGLHTIVANIACLHVYEIFSPALTFTGLQADIVPSYCCCSSFSMHAFVLRQVRCLTPPSLNNITDNRGSEDKRCPSQSFDGMCVCHMQLQRVTQRQAGPYTCTATNDSGTVSTTAVLTVLAGKMDPELCRIYISSWSLC